MKEYLFQDASVLRCHASRASNLVKVNFFSRKRISILIQATSFFSSLQAVQPGTDVHPVFYSVGSG